MEKAYEGILYKTLDSLNDKLAAAYEEWQKESMWIQVNHQTNERTTKRTNKKT